MANNKIADSMKTKTGKQRLGPLSLKQLYDLLDKESKAKNKGKIRNRISTLEKRGMKLPVEPIAESVTETV
jgi:hypothetical protein